MIRKELPPEIDGVTVFGVLDYVRSEGRLHKSMIYGPIERYNLRKEDNRPIRNLKIRVKGKELYVHTYETGQYFLTKEPFDNPQIREEILLITRPEGLRGRVSFEEKVRLIERVLSMSSNTTEAARQLNYSSANSLHAQLSRLYARDRLKRPIR